MTGPAGTPPTGWPSIRHATCYGPAPTPAVAPSVPGGEAVGALPMREADPYHRPVSRPDVACEPSCPAPAMATLPCLLLGSADAPRRPAPDTGWAPASNTPKPPRPSANSYSSRRSRRAQATSTSVNRSSRPATLIASASLGGAVAAVFGRAAGVGAGGAVTGLLVVLAVGVLYRWR
jgi:hypothetical protein